MRRSTKGIAVTTLDDSAYQHLLKPYRLKQLVNWIILLLGMALVALSIYAFIEEWLWGFPMVAPTILLLLGLWFVARIKMNPNHFMNSSLYIPTRKSNKEPLIHLTSETNELDFIRIRSMATSRLVAGLIPLCFAFLNSFIYGYEMGQNLMGTWFVLGGTSLFYPFSFILPMPIAIATLFFVLFSFKTIDISKSERLYQIEEYRFVGAYKTEIPRNEIRAVRITNSHMGPKYTWIFLMGLYIIWMYVDGFHFLLNPFAFGNGLIVGGMYVLSATIEFIILIFMILKTPTLVQIITNSKIYSLNIYLPSGSIDQTERLENIFDMNYKPDNVEDLLDKIPKDERYFSDKLNVIIGFIFIILAIVGKLTYFFTGFAFQIFLYMFGLMLIVEGFKNDFSSKNRENRILKLAFNEESSDLFTNWKFSWSKSAYKFSNCAKNDFEVSTKLATMNFFDVLLSIIIPFFIALTISGYFRFAPGRSHVYFFSYVYCIVGFILVLLVIHVTLNPKESLSIKNKSLKFVLRLPGIVLNSDNERGSMNKPSNSLMKRYLIAIKTQTFGFIIRVLLIVFGLILGIIFALII